MTQSKRRICVPTVRAPGARVLLLACFAAGACKEKVPADWVGQLVMVQGRATLNQRAGAKPVLARAGFYVAVGGEISTDADAIVHVRLRNGSSARLQTNTAAQFSSTDVKRLVQVELEQGSVEALVPAEISGEVLSIQARGKNPIHLKPGAQVVVPVEYTGLELKVGKVRLGPEEFESTKELVAFVKKRKAPKLSKTDKPKFPDRPTITAPEEIRIYLVASGKGRVLYKNHGSKRFRRAPKDGRAVAIYKDTLLKVGRGATLNLSADPKIAAKGEGFIVKGPAELRLNVDPPAPTALDAPPVFTVVPTGATSHITLNGRPGRKTTALDVQGVKVNPEVSWRRLDISIERGKNRSLVDVRRGRVLLVGRKRSVVVEAGQKATLRDGEIDGPSTPSPAVLEVSKPGDLRVFTSSSRNRVTLAIKGTDREGALIEVSRSPSFRHPVFADVVRRKKVTLTVGRGALYWRTRSVDAAGKLVGSTRKGRVSLFRYVPGICLHCTPPNTPILPQDSTVTYQNKVPRFTFELPVTSEAKQYRLRLFREANLARPFKTLVSRKPTFKVGRGVLREGTYRWLAQAWVGERLLRSSKMYKLRIRYDNSIPNLQIHQPKEGQTVSGRVTVKGITVNGSFVHVNRQPIALDAAYRFDQEISVPGGVSQLLFQVTHRLRGTTLYLINVRRR